MQKRKLSLAVLKFLHRNTCISSQNFISSLWKNKFLYRTYFGQAMKMVSPPVFKRSNKRNLQQLSVYIQASSCFLTHCSSAPFPNPLFQFSMKSRHNEVCASRLLYILLAIKELYLPWLVRFPGCAVSINYSI